MTAPRNILICDDEPDLVEALAEYLANFDWIVRTAGGGTQALALLEEGLRPSLLLTDVRMPDMDGGDLIRRVRTALPPLLQPLSVVAMTGHKNETGAEELRQAGADAVLFKPIDLETLNQTLDSLLQAGQAKTKAA